MKVGEQMKLNFKKTKQTLNLESQFLAFQLINETDLSLSKVLASTLALKTNLSLAQFKDIWVLSDQEKFDQMISSKKPYSQVVTLKEQKTFKLIFLPESNEGYLIYLPEIDLYKKQILDLEYITKQQETYVYQMSHELKTPLSALTSYLDLLKLEDLTKQQKDYISQMSLALDQGLHSMDAILQLSKLNYQKPVLSSDYIDIKVLMNDIYHIFEAACIKKKLYFRMTHQDHLVFISDEGFLKQILSNLVSNALKFTEHGGIEIETKYADKKLVISIKDTGIGMTDEEQLNLFKEFSQANKNISKIFGGTGLGLSITKELVLLLDGKIDVESTYGSGTTFNVYLPVEKAKIDRKEIEQDIILYPKSGLSVLIAEDNLLSLNATASLLKSIGLKVETAQNGKEAFSKFMEYPFDIILMDVSMPVLDGFDTTKKIREKDHKIPIVAMTANTYQEHVDSCLDIGMNDVLFKPFKAKDLYKIIYKNT